MKDFEGPRSGKNRGWHEESSLVQRLLGILKVFWGPNWRAGEAADNILLPPQSDIPHGHNPGLLLLIFLFWIY